MQGSLIADLKRLLSPGQVSEAPDDLERHGEDALGRYRAFQASEALDARPQGVVWPQNAQEVMGVTSYATERGVPLVPYGGGTGVMGGIVPVRGGIVMDLKRLNRIHQIDKEARTATVGAGVVLEELVQALEPKGLIFGHDPWSVPVATVGGAISTNGVGYLAGKYGPMGDQVLGLEVALPSGDLIQTRGVPVASGPSLKSLFIGAEGTLGIITKATLQLFPAPEQRSLYAYGFSDFEAAFSAVQEMHSLGLRPSLVDMAEEFSWSGDAGAEEKKTTLYLGFEGPREEVEGQVERGLSLCRHHGGEDQGAEEAWSFWRQRHQSGERYKREVQQAPLSARRQRRDWHADYLHVSLPVSRVLEYRRQCQELLVEYGIPVREWSIWGRPELFSFLITDPDPNGDVTVERMGTAVDALLKAGHDLGGSMEYCHGVGLKLTHLMEREFGPGLAVLRRVKKALDPAGVLNPGKLGM